MVGLYRYVMFSQVLKFNKQPGLTQVKRYFCIVPPVQFSRPGSFLRAENNTAITQATTNPCTMASQTKKSCSRCLSSKASSQDGKARVKRVSIEGNIAIGKSTFARLLQSACSDWEVMAEPVSKWQNIESETSKAVDEPPQKTVSNLLQMMYQEPQRWSYTFQTYSCMSRLRTQLQPPPAHLLHSEGTPVQVYERSVYSDRVGSLPGLAHLPGGAVWTPGGAGGHHLPHSPASEMYGATGAAEKVRGAGSETGISGEASCST